MAALLFLEPNILPPTHGLCPHYSSPHSLHFPSLVDPSDLYANKYLFIMDQSFPRTASLGQGPLPVLLQSTYLFVIILPSYDYPLCVPVLG